MRRITRHKTRGTDQVRHTAQFISAKFPGFVPDRKLPWAADLYAQGRGLAAYGTVGSFFLAGSADAKDLQTEGGPYAR